MKKVINPNRLKTTNRLQIPISSATPSNTSRITKNTANGREKTERKSRLKTAGLKYSSNLNEKPSGSLSLMSPEIIKRSPTKTRMIDTTIFMPVLGV